MVVPVFFAVEAAELSAVCVAELGPLFTSPPAMLTGTFALTAFCFAVASESASCFVRDAWSTFCSWPEPPQPDLQLEPPVACVGFAVCVVVPVFVAVDVPEFDAFCVAELGPSETLPPAMLTGTLALTAFWSAVALESASC